MSLAGNRRKVKEMDGRINPILVQANIEMSLAITFNIISSFSWIHIPLRKTNYLWLREKFASVLLVHDLEHLIDERYVPPTRTISEQDG